MPPTPKPNYRNDTAYVARQRALKRRARRNNTPCHICGHAIDYTLHWKHPMSFTADHITPVANGGHMLGELAPAHRSCNSRRGTKQLTTLKPIRNPKHSQPW